MPITAEEYWEEARGDIDAAERNRAEGTEGEAKEWYLTAVLDMLRAAVRSQDGLALLRKSRALGCAREASRLSALAHPTYLLDAAHVALLLGEASIAQDWLTVAASAKRWSVFWGRYASDLCAFVRDDLLGGEPVALDMPEQQVWVPYVELMQALSVRHDTSEALRSVHISFRERQAQLNDPGLLDGRLGDPIIWDWRLETILTVSQLRRSEGA